MPVTTTANVVAKKFLAEKRVLITRARKDNFSDGVNLHKTVDAAKEYLTNQIKENGDNNVPYIIWQPVLVVHPEVSTVAAVNVGFRDRSVEAVESEE